MLSKLDLKSYHLSDITLNMISEGHKYMMWRNRLGCADITVAYQQITESIYYLDFECDDNLIEARITLSNQFNSSSDLYGDLLELYRHEFQHMHQYLFENISVNETDSNMTRLTEIDAYLFGLRLKSKFLKQHLVETIHDYIDKLRCERDQIELIRKAWLNRAQDLKLV
jgi:hypothetical protein